MLQSTLVKNHYGKVSLRQKEPENAYFNGLYLEFWKSVGGNSNAKVLKPFKTEKEVSCAHLVWSTK